LGSLGMMDGWWKYVRSFGPSNLGCSMLLGGWTINALQESLSMSTHAVSQANPVDLVPGKWHLRDESVEKRHTL
jgi:hypothetical protein